jgi:fibronectin type III domain protein
MRPADVVRRRFLAALVLAGAAAGCGAGKSGVLDVSWTAPAANADGSPTADIASYRVYYGTTPDPCPGGTHVTVPSPPVGPGQTVTTRLTRLSVGEVYHVAVTAVSSSGAQSACSTAAANRARKPD